MKMSDHTNARQFYMNFKHEIIETRDFKCFNALPVYTCTGAQGLTYSGV